MISGTVRRSTLTSCWMAPDMMGMRLVVVGSSLPPCTASFALLTSSPPCTSSIPALHLVIPAVHLVIPAKAGTQLQLRPGFPLSRE